MRYHAVGCGTAALSPATRTLGAYGPVSAAVCQQEFQRRFGQSRLAGAKYAPQRAVQIPGRTAMLRYLANRTISGCQGRHLFLFLTEPYSLIIPYYKYPGKLPHGG